MREWKSAGHGVRRSSFYYHWARLIEILYALERIEQLLDDPDICSTDIMVTARPANAQGVGVIEAPRGTLFHHYWVDENGRIEKVNLIVATGHNNLAMNRAVLAVAKKYVKAQTVAGRHAQPRRSGHPLLRPVLELLDARRRPDAVARATRRAGRHGAERNGARLDRDSQRPFR